MEETMEQLWADYDAARDVWRASHSPTRTFTELLCDFLAARENLNSKPTGLDLDTAVDQWLSTSAALDKFMERP